MSYFWRAAVQKAPAPIIVGKSPQLFFWGAPALILGGWLIYPCLDMDYRVEKGWESPPDAGLKKVAEAKQARLEAFQNRGKPAHVIAAEKAKAAAPKPAPVPEPEPEEDEEEEEVTEEEEESSDSSGDDDDEESEEADDKALTAGSVKLPKETLEEMYENWKPGSGTTVEELWKNTYLKSVKAGDDEDDEDDDDEDEEEEEEDEEEVADEEGEEKEESQPETTPAPADSGSEDDDDDDDDDNATPASALGPFIPAPVSYEPLPEIGGDDDDDDDDDNDHDEGIPHQFNAPDDDDDDDAIPGSSLGPFIPAPVSYEPAAEEEDDDEDDD